MQRSNKNRMPLSVGSLAGAVALLASAASGQVDVGIQTQVDTTRGPNPCNETTMSAAASNPLVVVGGWNDYREGSPRTGIGLSTDGGETWNDFLLRAPAPHQSGVEGDPMTAYDNRTGTLWAGGMSFAGNGGIFVARKDISDAAFQPPVMARISGSVDKGWMAAGPDPADPMGNTLLYVAYNQGLIRSTDMGATWTAPVSLGSGLGFLPRTGPNGELYIAYWNVGSQVNLIRSFDGGVTLSAPITIANRMDVWGIDGSRFPGNYRVASLEGLCVDQVSGDLYCVYPDTTDNMGGNANVDVYFTRSQDQGSTWSVPVVMNGDNSPTGDQFFPWIEIDENGRLHVVYNDTRLNAQNDSAPQGLIDVFYAYSDDQGATWTEERLTPATWSSATDGFGGGFIGDYLGMSSAGGRTLPLYVDTAPNGNADVFTHVISDGPTSYCFGLGCPCGNDDPDAGCGNTGFDGNATTGSLLSSSGSTSVGADDLVIRGSGVNAGTSGLLFAGTTRINAPFGDGQRCVGGQTFRYPVRAADGAGVITYGPNELVAISQNFAAAGQVNVNSTFHYQLWYRDPMSPCGNAFNTSNALTVQWQ